MKDDDWKKLNKKCMDLIWRWVDESIFHHIFNKISAQSLWNELESLYERKTIMNKAFLIRNLVNLKFKEGSSISEHLNEFKSFVNWLATMSLTLDDELQALLLLVFLPNNWKPWKTLVVSISNYAHNGKLTMDLVSNNHLNENTRHNLAKTSTTHALVVEDRGRSKSQGLGDRGKSKNRSKSKSRIIYHHCQKSDHIKRFCRQLKRE